MILFWITTPTICPEYFAVVRAESAEEAKRLLIGEFKGWSRECLQRAADDGEVEVQQISPDGPACVLYWDSGS